MSKFLNSNCLLALLFFASSASADPNCEHSKESQSLLNWAQNHLKGAEAFNDATEKQSAQKFGEMINSYRSDHQALGALEKNTARTRFNARNFAMAKMFLDNNMLAATTMSEALSEGGPVPQSEHEKVKKNLVAAKISSVALISTLEALTQSTCEKKEAALPAAAKHFRQWALPFLDSFKTVEQYFLKIETATHEDMAAITKELSRMDAYWKSSLQYLDSNQNLVNSDRMARAILIKNVKALMETTEILRQGVTQPEFTTSQLELMSFNVGISKIFSTISRELVSDQIPLRTR